MFNSIVEALFCAWLLSLFSIDRYVVDFMRTAMNIPQAQESYYYVLFMALGVLSYCIQLITASR